MNRYLDTKLGMYKAVKATLQANAATITAAAVPIIGTYETDLTDHLDAIENISGRTEIETKGVTYAKQYAREALIISTCTVAGAIYPYAVDTNNIILASNSNISLSLLEALKDEELIPVVKKIHTQALEFVTVTPPAVNPLANYGVGTPEVGALGGLIEVYRRQTTAPRSEIVKRKSSRKSLVEEFKLTDELLYKFDKVIYGQKYAYPDFYAEYFSARKIIGPTTLGTQIIGQVSIITDVNLLTTAVVEDAKVTIIAQPYTRVKNGQIIRIAPMPVIIVTDAEGKYACPTPDYRTTYTVVCQYTAGYGEQQTTNIRVKRGKKTELNFRLEPLQ